MSNWKGRPVRTRIKCPCGREWQAVRISSFGSLFLCFPCWLRAYLKNGG